MCHLCQTAPRDRERKGRARGGRGGRKGERCTSLTGLYVICQVLHSGHVREAVIGKIAGLLGHIRGALAKFRDFVKDH